MDVLTVSVVLLWLAVLVLGVMLWALSRQVGVLFERVAPMGALVTDSGPAVGTESPQYDLRGIQSEPVQIGAELYGHDGVESDIEIIRLMLDSLQLAGARDIHLDLGHGRGLGVKLRHDRARAA